MSFDPHCTRLDGSPRLPHNCPLSERLPMKPLPVPPAARPRLPAGERREVLLAAARRVFGRSGYHAATTREIAAAAGVSEALLYQHFSSKRELFIEVIETAAADLERRVLAARAGADPAAAGLAAYFDFVEQESELYRVFFRQALLQDPALQQLWRRLWQRFIGLLRDTGALSEAAAHALAGMLNELALWWLEDAGLSKAVVVDRAVRYARAVCETEVDDGRAGPD